MPPKQLELSLIPHTVENALILQREKDGYVNATQMCQAVGKLLGHYNALRSTQEFYEALSDDIGITISELVMVVKGGNPSQQGTWVHPKVAINLGQWCSPRFAVAVSNWVHDWMTGKVKTGLPYHIARYIENQAEVPHTHFSMLNEMIFALIGPMEAKGFTLPENMLPDISTGRMFCKWLREKRNIDTDALPTYRHKFADGRVVAPKLYPISVLEDFRRHLHESWIPMESKRYFRERAPEALPILDEIILALPAPKRRADLN